MSENKENQDNNKRNKPESNANPVPVPEDASNTANHKGAVDLGTEGTKPSASQQQGQGAWNKKTDARTGSPESDSGKNAENKSDKKE